MNNHLKETAIITMLITAIAAQSAAIVYLYKRGERREKEYIRMLSDLINRNNLLTERMEKVLQKVEVLLTNWRAR